MGAGSTSLRERYKNKPEQLRNVVANARQITHPIRKCTLHLDTNFRFSSSKETSHHEETKRASYSKDAQRAPLQPKKKARVDPTPKAGKPLTDKQRVALQAAAAKSRASAEKELAWLQDEGLQDEHISKPLKDAAQRSAAHVQAALMAAELAQDLRWTGSGSAVQAELPKTTKPLTMIAKQMKDTSKTAKACLAQT